jgi:hypothetical protein
MICSFAIRAKSRAGRFPLLRRSCRASNVSASARERLTVFDHVTLTRGAAALAVATNALAVKFSPPQQAPAPSAMGGRR